MMWRSLGPGQDRCHASTLLPLPYGLNKPPASDIIDISTEWLQYTEANRGKTKIGMASKARDATRAVSQKPSTPGKLLTTLA